MAIRPYLQDDRRTSKAWFKGRILFNLVFIFSLGLNVYLLTHPQNPGFLFAPENREMGVPQVGIESNETTHPAQVGPIHIPGDVAPLNAIAGPVRSAVSHGVEGQKVSPSFSITPAAYAMPDTTPRLDGTALHLTIRNSLTHSVCQVMTRENGCETLSAYMSRLLSWFFDTKKSMRNGDTLDLVYEKVPEPGRFRILKLVYDSHHFNKVFEANYFRADGQGEGAYYNPDGVEIAKRILSKFAPVRHYKEITSLPGDFRKGPVGHEGTDFKTEVGTDVFASFEGRVTRTNWNRRMNGFCVELDHPREGVKTLYLHLSRVLIKKGQFVKQGEKIAETGNTGRTFAPHLHFEIKSRGAKKIVYNPFNFKHIKTFYPKVSGQELDHFQETVDRYNSIIQKG